MVGRPRERGRRGRRIEQDEMLPPGERAWLHPSELPPAPGRRESHRGRLGVTVTAGLAGALAAFGLTSLGVGLWASSSGSGPATTIAGRAGPVTTGSRSLGRDDFERVAGAVSPAVVGVTAWAGAQARHGSGVTYRHDGLVVTSAHLIADSGAVEVIVPGRGPIPAQVVGTDAANDVALLEVEGPIELRAASFEPAPTNATRSGGAACMVIGVSGADHRTWMQPGSVTAHDAVVTVGSDWMVGVLQIDVRSENPMSGGAVFDGAGRLLGVVSDRGSDEVGGSLAIPAATLARSVEQLIERGRVDHPWLGVATLDSQGGAVGAVVHLVAPGGPAERAGVAPGDVIVRLGSHEVSDMASLLRAVRRHEVGDTIRLEAARAGSTRTMTVTLERRP